MFPAIFLVIFLNVIELETVLSEVLKVEKEINFEEAIFEYEFRIKEKDKMLQIVKLDAQNGVILRVNDQNSNKENDKHHGED